MSRCSICEHENRPTIDQALATGESLRDIAQKYGTSKSTLSRHREHQEFAGAVAVEEVEPGEPDPPEAEALEQTGQAPIVEAAPVKEPQKPLSPAEARWDQFLEELERLEAKARQETPRPQEIIGRLEGEERVGRQKLAILVEREAKLMEELANLQTKELDLIERGEPGNLAGEWARVAEELPPVRLALQAEQSRFEELARQVGERTHGLQTQIEVLEQAPGEFMGETWKRWWYGLKKAEEAVTEQKEAIRHETLYGYPDEVEELKFALPLLVAERDILRYCVGRLASLLKKKKVYLEALIQARVLRPDFQWPPMVRKTELLGTLGGYYTRETWVPDPRWATA